MEYYFDEGKYEEEVNIAEIDKQIIDMEKEITAYQQQFADAKNRTFMKDNFTGYAFVTFESEQSMLKKYYLDAYFY